MEDTTRDRSRLQAKDTSFSYAEVASITFHSLIKPIFV